MATGPAAALNVLGLEIKLKLLGSEHPNVAVTYHNLAAVYRRQGNQVQTKEMATKAYHKVLGPDHPHTQVSSRLFFE